MHIEVKLKLSLSYMHIANFDVLVRFWVVACLMADKKSEHTMYKIYY